MWDVEIECEEWDRKPGQTSVCTSYATCAPMAAGNPNPIVPSDPEVTIERGVVQRKN